MSKRPLYAVLLLIVAGCAGTGVSLFPGEKNAKGEFNPTGAVAVLDPLTGEDVAVLDQANSKNGVRKRRVSVKNVTAAALDTKYGALLAGLPEQPRKFVLYFKEGTSELVDSSLLPEMFAEVKRRPGVDVQIVGHTDTTGSTELNDNLSVKRADEIKNLLAGLGLDGEIVRATGRGEREPAKETADNIAEAENRRVEVIVK